MNHEILVIANNCHKGWRRNMQPSTWIFSNSQQIENECEMLDVPTNGGSKMAREALWKFYMFQRVTVALSNRLQISKNSITRAVYLNFSGQIFCTRWRLKSQHKRIFTTHCRNRSAFFWEKGRSQTSEKSKSNQHSRSTLRILGQ